MIKKTYYIFVFLAFMTMNAFAQKDGTHTLPEKEKAEINKVLDDYIKTFSAKDLKGWEGTYQFPHYRLASGKMNVLEKAGLRDSAAVFGPLIKAGWDYSKWDHRNIIQASDTKVHVDTKFTRFKKDGSKIASYESLYVLTKEEGRWGVKLRSSFAE
ncbi:hypothetical protein ACFP1I_30200 [Dyadobacter subterraneus]|uniref:Nuclear transport factor 2 family protein n=1 Tax=Dyadobacter subterraneus TaxID=2773304 RepID=A0ABR9WBI3_9BACT|nr:hypothetical protein [Dyadobacter subterraneus]MBE9462790.1 hypothetical protein [Dyadobacter subterraneus]